MPGKKKKGGGKKKKGGGKKPKLPGNETAEQILKRFLKTYERNCVAGMTMTSTRIHKAIRTATEEDTIITKFIIEGEPLRTPEDMVVKLDPLVTTIRQERYAFVTDLHVWDIPLDHEEIASLALLIEKGFYPLRQIELLDCLIEPYPLRRFALSLNLCPTITHIILDYNEFGDDGCHGLCEGLVDNTSVISISMNYCDLGVLSGRYLGAIVATTSVRELYLDGNNLECEGAIELIKLCADHAEIERYEKEEEARRKAEEEAAIKELEAQNRGYTSGASAASGSAGGKKKKKKGKKKKKEVIPPPPPGPWISKLHLEDNGIDNFSSPQSQNKFLPLICMRIFKKLLKNSTCLEELDLDDNLIGDIGGHEILEGLKHREEASLPGVKVRTTHRMENNTFSDIISLGSGLSKKKKKGKKKK